MLPRAFIIAFLLSFPLQAVIIDRIAVRVGNAIIKDSDIDRIVRVTEFLNDEPLDLSNKARRDAMKRLIDQAFIRQEIQVGGYPRADWDEADEQIAKLKKDRYKTAAAFEQALARYGLVEPDLRFEFQWQLTVLRFVDLRFRPAVLVKDEEVEQYYREHLPALRKANPGDSSLNALREEINDILVGEKVNQLFFSWLDDHRREGKVEITEESLR
jgi:parvulin-like peptidyl-prolyl isomerase